MLTFIHVSMPNKIPEISPKFVDGKRMYETPDGNFPSITTVLGKLPRFSFGIKNWIEKVGEDFAKFESKRCLERGSQFHKIVQSYLENKFDTNGFGLLAKSLFENTKDEINQINFIQGVELPLWSKELSIAGTTDCIGNYKNTLSVIDFKTATRPKKKEWLTSYFLQETAYSLMYEERVGIPIEQLVTIVSSEDGQVKVFVESRDNFVDELKGCLAEFQQNKVVA